MEQTFHSRISLMLLNNISCIDYEDNVNPNEVTEEMMEADNLKTGAFFFANAAPGCYRK